MNGNYRFMPEDFSGLLNLPEELWVLYGLIENYKKESSDDNWFGMKKQWEDLFFTIKHREIEGFLHPSTASELREYLEELVNA